jgi:hypothetical protein
MTGTTLLAARRSSLDVCGSRCVNTRIIGVVAIIPLRKQQVM